MLFYKSLFLSGIDFYSSRMKYILNTLFLVTTFCFAGQPFEMLSVTPGVVPLYQHPVDSDVLVLQSAEQFVRFVSSADTSTVVLLDRGAQCEHEARVRKALGALQDGVQLHVLNADTHLPLIRALARTIGLQKIEMPRYILFVNGTAVLPGIPGGLSADELREKLSEQVLYAQHGASIAYEWWDKGMAWVQDIWTKIAMYLSSLF